MNQLPAFAARRRIRPAALNHAVKEVVWAVEHSAERGFRDSGSSPACRPAGRTRLHRYRLGWRIMRHTQTIRVSSNPADRCCSVRMPRRNAEMGLAHHRMPSRDPVKRTELPPHRIGTAMDVGEHLHLRLADRIPADRIHNPWQDDGMSAPLLLLDGASMWFRSYFGVPSSITAPDGRPVNAVRGFLDAVATLITREHPSRLVVCRDDDWRPQWRVDLIPSYKAHRVAVDRAGRPARHRRGARRSDTADRHDSGDPGCVRHSDGGCARV